MKLSGNSGRIKIGNTVGVVTPVTSSAGITTITTAAAHGLSAGMFVLISGAAGMTDLNNGGKALFVLSAPTTTTLTVKLTSSQTYTSGGTLQRVIPITEWDINPKADKADQMDSESGGWKENTISSLGFTGTYKALQSDGQHAPLFGVQLPCELDIDKNNFYTATLSFDGYKIGAKIAGANQVAIDGTFEGSGALVFTTNANPS